MMQFIELKISSTVMMNDMEHLMAHFHPSNVEHDNVCLRPYIIIT